MRSMAHELRMQLNNAEIDNNELQTRLMDFDRSMQESDTEQLQVSTHPIIIIYPSFKTFFNYWITIAEVAFF